MCRLDGEQREHDLRAVFNALRWLVRSGAHWRMMPHDFPPWAAVYQQMQRWLRAGCFEAMVHDLRVLLREYAGRKGQPSAMILDSRTMQSTPESGARAGYDGAKQRKGAKVHAAVDTLGHLFALHLPPADEQDRAQVQQLAQAVPRRIPVVIMTSSQEESDLVQSYELGVNSYVVKPVDFTAFADITRQAGYYWLAINRTPTL